jgi:tetratricopeptide (TPR) repeat protein
MTLVLGAGAAAAPAGETVSEPEALLQESVELYSLGQYAEALPVAKRALAAAGKAYGRLHPSIGTCLNNMGQIHRAQGNAKEAEPLFKSALAIFLRTLGPNHPMVATTLVNLAEVYKAQERTEEAEGLLKRAREIRGQIAPAGMPETARQAGTHQTPATKGSAP